MLCHFLGSVGELLRNSASLWILDFRFYRFERFWERVEERLAYNTTAERRATKLANLKFL